MPSKVWVGWAVTLLATAAAPCLAQSLFSPETAATLVQATGQVSVDRDGASWALSVGQRVKPQQVIVTGPDGYAVFQISDGSRFEVYPNSRVTFRNNPGHLRDLLDVWLGRVKVQIQHLTGKPNPQRVHTATAVISVRGTVFHVEVEDADATTLVLVDEGQVAVQHALLPFGAPRLLSEGEWIRVFKNQPLATKMVDRGSLLRAAFRAMSDAFYTVMARTSSPGGGTGAPVPTGGGAPPPLPGDRDGGTPPPGPGTGSGGSAPTPPAPPPPPAP